LSLVLVEVLALLESVAFLAVCYRFRSYTRYYTLDKAVVEDVIGLDKIA
jgi:hypothetical protein